MSIHRINAGTGHGVLKPGFSSRVGDWVLIALAVAAVLALYAVAAKFDENEDAALHQMAQAERERLAMPKRVAAAYEAGMAAALDANRSTPQGVALAQACLGSGFTLRGTP